MMPSSTSESWARICDCWCAGNTSITRLMVEDAELVCKVPKVRWPVSAIRSADSMVSRSRISPISTTSGSSRRAARRASVKLLVSECTSRWLTTQFLFMCTNSNCVVNQREVHSDTKSFTDALRAALREDPDVVLIGEMRDLETIE